MRKNIITLGCLLLIIAGLAAALMALRQPDTQQPEPESESGSSALSTVYELSASVRSIRIEQAGSPAFTLQNLAADSDSEPASTLLGRESLPVDTSRINEVLKSAKSLSYTELLFEDIPDLQPYGLAPPRARVEITDMGGASVTLIIGDTAPGNSGVYLMLEGSPALYLVPVYLLDKYLLPEPDYLSHTVTPSSSELDFSQVTLGGTVREEQGEVIIEPAQAKGKFRLSSPVSHGIDPVAGVEALRSLFGIQSESIAATEPIPEDLAALGLDSPYATAVVEGGGSGGFSLKVSEPDETGLVYLYREDVPLLYTVRADSMLWLTLQFYDMMDKTAHAPDIGELSSVTAAAPEKTWTFALSGEGTELSVSLDGISVDTDSFRAFYRTLISAELTEPAIDSPPEDAAPILLVTYSYRSGDEHTVAFYDGPARRCYINVDGGRFYLTQSVYAEGVLEELVVLATEQAAGNPG